MKAEQTSTGPALGPAAARRVLVWCCLLVVPGLTGCGAMSVMHRNQAIGVVAAAAASATPSADVQQTYYLGSFDPRSQLPPAIYRIQVRGQSGLLNATRFASGWVPADVVDSLTGSIGINAKTGKVSTERGGSDPLSLDGVGRGLVMFGPEGFREAPRNHRLVVILGSSPEDVEQAFASALGTVAKVKFGQSGAALDSELFSMLLKLGQERDQLKALADER